MRSGKVRDSVYENLGVVNWGLPFTVQGFSSSFSKLSMDIEPRFFTISRPFRGKWTLLSCSASSKTSDNIVFGAQFVSIILFYFSIFGPGSQSSTVYTVLQLAHIIWEMGDHLVKQWSRDPRHAPYMDLFRGKVSRAVQHRHIWA